MANADPSMVDQVIADRAAVGRLSAEWLFSLLPALYRVRDRDQGRQLEALLDIVAEQIALVQEGIDQAYDDAFIETCAEWVVPYIGDLIGARLVKGRTAATHNERAQVANTLAYRRRKGTLAILEQLSRDVTDYPSVAIEMFQLLTTTQFMNHPRPAPLATIDVRQREVLERIDTAFDRSAHTMEARRIVSGRGRYNISNIGLFLYRLQAFPLRQVNARRLDDHRYLFNPIGIDTPLFNQPITEDTITHLAEPDNVPAPITRLAMSLDKGRFYGTDRSILVQIAGQPAPIPPDKVELCHLGDKTDGSGLWAHSLSDKYGIDPVLGRLALPTSEAAPDPKSVLVTFHAGFSDTIGGGEYERADTLGVAPTQIGGGGTGLQAALTAVASGGVVEFRDSLTYSLPSAVPNLQVAARSKVELRSANERRATIEVMAGDFLIEAEEESTVRLNGLVIFGGAVIIAGKPKAVELVDCTLVPGISRTRMNEPATPGAPSLKIESDDVAVAVRRSILGSITIPKSGKVSIEHSVVDATAENLFAYSGGVDSAGEPKVGGAVIQWKDTTVIGRVYARRMEEVSNCILLAKAPTGSSFAVKSERLQEGCVRFCYVPPQSSVPRRYRCQPTNAADDDRLKPIFTSLRYGVPGYGQLDVACPPEIRQGAEDGSEMGVFHDLYQAQRETNLRLRLEEYLRFGLEAGILYET